jgi:hypothetical protein
MIKLQYPTHPFKLKTETGSETIFDELRKRWIKLTPEEWVRQNFVQYLVQIKKYPASLVAIEKEIYLNELKKRFDVLVYSKQHRPWMMVECKSMEVPISEKILEQMLVYNLALPVQYLVITNGSYCYAAERKGGSLVYLAAIPDW